MKRTNYRAQRGFSIVEVMVGLLIGMGAVIVMLQLLSSSDVSKRVSSGADEAQINAMLALNTLERDLRQAGHGISAFNLLGCTLSYTTTGDSASVTLSALGPLTINPSSSLIPDGDSNTDTLLVVGGNSSGPSEGDPTTATSTTTTYTITTPSNFSSGDWVLGAKASWASGCALTLGKITSIGSYALTVSSATSGLSSGAIVYNLGSAPSIKAYAIRKSNLTVCDYLKYDCGSSSYTSTLNSTVWVPVVRNVVSLRAQYGHDISNLSSSAMTGVVGQFDQYSPGDSSDPTSSVAVYCRWARIIGLRLAVVGRSTHYDKTAPTSTSPTWSGSTANSSTSSSTTTLNPEALSIDLSGQSDYQYFRYRLLESSVPLRNMIWQGSQTTYQGGSGGC